MQECIWCGRQHGVVRDWLIYPHHTDPVPEVEANHVWCCLSCRSLRNGRSVASWLADCLEGGRPANPKQVYEQLRDLDQDHPGKRTGVELRKLRRMLDVRYKTTVSRQVKMNGLLKDTDRQCIWCGRPLSSKHIETSVEHVVPRSRQGSNHPENLLPACIDCNSKRSNLSPARWIEKIVEQGKQPRVDMIWDTLTRLHQHPPHGIRIRRRAHQFQIELMELLWSGKLDGQPYLPPQPWQLPPAPPAPKPRKKKSDKAEG